MQRYLLILIFSTAWLLACGSSLSQQETTPAADFSRDDVSEIGAEESPVAAFSKAALAAPAPTSISRDDASLVHVLGPLEWGMSREEVLLIIEAQLLADYRVEAAELQDAHKRDILRRRHARRFQDVKDSYRSLDPGVRSGLELSIVYDEFAKGHGESFLKVRQRDADRYLFFVDDRLYKLSIAYTPEAVQSLDFLSFIALVARKHGALDVAFEDDLAQIIEAVWERGQDRLRAKDRPEYGAFLLTYSSATLEARVESAHAAALAALIESPSDLDALSCDPPDCDLDDPNAAASLVDGEQPDLRDAPLSPEETRALEERVGDERTDATRGGVKKDPSKARRPRPRKPRRSNKNVDLDSLEKNLSGDDQTIIIY